MATLGEAFIAVRADMSPFRRELYAETKKIADSVEKGLGTAVEKGIKDGADKGSRAAGDKAGDNLADGIKNKVGDKDRNPWLAVAGALGGALDDGISALPTELKAVIVAGIIAALPIIGAALTGAIGAATAAGVAILGIALASQFESVQTRFTTFATRVRNSLVDAAQPFAEATIGVMDVIEDQIFSWAPLLNNLFEQSASFVLPLINGVLDGINFILESIDRGLEDGDAFVSALSDSFAILGDAVGQALEIIMSTGELGADAFRDFVYATSLLIVGAAELLRIFTGLYTFLRRTVQLIPDWLLALQPYLLVLKGIANASDEAENSTTAYAYTNVQFVEGMGDVITLTKDEEKALKELEKQIDAARDAAFKSIATNIEWEQAIDDLEEGFKRNGKTIDIETERGRKNLRNLGDAIKAAQAQAEDRVRTGVMNAEQAREAYRREIEEIYKVAAAHGITRAQIDAVYGSALALVNLPPPNSGWLAEWGSLAAALAGNLERANRAAWNLPNRPGGPQPFAEGGIVYGPTQALIGEAGREAVIPLTKPARAAQLMRESGLDQMISGGGDTVVYVYLGNEAFDQHVQKIVVQNNRSQAQQLTYGVRG